MVKKLLLFYALLITGIISAQLPTNGQMFHYEFTNGSITGLTKHGSGATFVNDRFSQPNNAINLGGDRLVKSDFGYSSNQATIAFWIKTTNNSATVKTIYDDANNRNSVADNTNWSGHYILLQNGKIGYVVQQLYQASNVGNGGRVGIKKLSSKFIADGGWHHVALTFRFTSAGTGQYRAGREIRSYRTNAKLYIDGVLSTSSSDNRGSEFGYLSNGNWQTSGNMSIASNRSNNLPQANRYNDSFDDLVIYNRELSGSEINSVIANGGYCLPEPVSNFNFLNVTPTQATINFANSATFDIAYHKKTETFNNAVIVTGIDKTGAGPRHYNLTGLEEFTEYSVYIKTQDCQQQGWSVAKDLKTTRPNVPFYVNANATGNGSGLSWTNAYTSLNAALSALGTVSVTNPQIWMAKGVYKPSISSRTVSFNLNKVGLKVYGGFAGNETTLNDREISLIHSTNETVLSGDLREDDDSNITFNNTTRDDNSLRVVTVTANNVEIDGVTISGGYADASSGNGRFGAGLSLNGNYTDFTIKNSVIKENVAYWAAGMVLSGSSSTLMNYNIESCIFERNLSSLAASSVYVLSTANTNLNFKLINSLFKNNRTADNGSRKGLGISTLWVRSYYAGAVINPTIVNNTFTNNINGGTGNSDFGTIGMSQQSGTFGTINIANNIFWGNQDNSGNAALAIGKAADNSLASNLSVSNSIDENDFSNITTKVNTSNNNPLFVNAGTGDFTLQASSPAVDAGDNTKLPSGTLTDLLEKVRIHNATVDMGAYEFGAANYLPRTLTINATNGSVSTNPNPINNVYNDGTSVTLTATPNAGYQFDGWSGGATGSTNPLTITMDADKTVTAMFSKIQRTLTINATNGSVSTNPNPTGGTYDHGTNVTLTATPNAGYQFDGWSGDATGSTNPLSITMDADKTVTAMFSKIQRTLTINATNGSVSTNPNPTGGTYDDGTNVTLTATPNAGYQFDGWSGAATGTTNPLAITMDADKTVTALFSKIQRTLTINATNGSVSTNPNPTGGTYDDGTSVVLTATPNAGYQFDGWSGDATGTTNPLTITMDADKTVTALFSKIQRTLTINATNGSVSTNPNPTGGTYDDGTNVTLTVTPNAGYQFDGWSGAATGSTNPLTITMDADKTVTALFSKIQRTLTINATNGSVSTNPNPTGGTYDDGTSVTLTATPNAGYQFERWTGDLTSIMNPIAINMNSNKTVTAVFTAIPQYTLTITATNGTVTTNPNPVNGTYAKGTVIEMTAVPDAGYKFDGWKFPEAPINTTNPLSFPITRNLPVTAIFSPVTASVVDEEFNSQVKIYPIPVTDILNIEVNTGYEVKKVIVYNLLGKKILEEKETTIDVSYLVKGIYLFKITDTKGRIALRKIIKK